MKKLILPSIPIIGFFIVVTNKKYLIDNEFLELSAIFQGLCLYTLFRVLICN